MVLRRRHLAKALTYRAFGSLATAGIAYAFTGRPLLSTSIGVADSLAKVGLYYLHERAWYRVRWGVRPPLAAELEAKTVTLETPRQDQAPGREVVTAARQASSVSPS